MNTVTRIALSAATIALLSGCSDTTITQTPSSVTIDNSVSNSNNSSASPTNPSAPVATECVDPTKQETLSGDLTQDKTLTADTLWILDGLVAVKNGATLTIEPCTTVAGLAGTGDATSYMIIDKGAKIIADGTSEKPITFTSSKVAVDGADADVGQWGGLTIIGHAGNAQVNPYEVNTAYEADATDLTDSSGILRHVFILNSGITMAEDKEINGLSLVGVGSGTVMEDIIVDLSDDDGIEIWGGTVNLTNVTVTRCTDDYFDIDDGYAGTVKNLVVTTTTGNAGIEMSGETSATFDGFSINTGATQAKEGAIYFKKDKIGGHFKNGTIVHNGGQLTADGAIHSRGKATIENVSFENVSITAPDNLLFTGDSAVALESKFYSDASNSTGCTIPSSTTLAGELTGCTILTSDKVWELHGLVVVTPGAQLRILEGTTIVGVPGTGDATSYMIVDKGAQIFALGTAANPIVFTSQDTTKEEVGLWGGLTLIGHAGNDQVQPYEVNTAYAADATDLTDSSGILRHMKILNSGITMAEDKEINGISFVGVGSGTIVEDITVDYSDDDCVEIWGGTVNLTGVTVSHCTDDHFDIDDGYAGTVKDLVINQTGGNAGIEMSGHTVATFDGFTITQDSSAKEGGIYFKKDGIGGHFLNGTVIDNSVEGAGAIHSRGTADTANISFANVTLEGTSTDERFTDDSGKGGSASEIEALFASGTGNTQN